jgi:hypothetical protein
VEVIASCSDLLDDTCEYQLILRYQDRYYIRFELDSGFIAELPVSEIPTGKDVVKLIKDKPDEMIRIVNAFRKKGDWTETSYIQSTIVDCLLYSGDMPIKQASKIWSKLSRYDDLVQEMYNMIVEGTPGFRSVKAAGFTAAKLMEMTQMTIIGAYLFMVALREEPQKALPQLKDMIIDKETANYGEA